jgi:hypothetical protein
MSVRVKQFVKQNTIDNGHFSKNGIKSYLCQRSSVVEQRFRKPRVVGSNPIAGSRSISPFWGLNYSGGESSSATSSSPSSSNFFRLGLALDRLQSRVPSPQYI